MSDLEKELGFGPVPTEAVERYKAFSTALDALLEAYPVEQRHQGTVFARKLDALVQQYGVILERPNMFTEQRERDARSTVRKLIDRVLQALFK